MICNNCGTFVQQGSYCFECGYALRPRTGGAGNASWAHLDARLKASFFMLLAFVVLSLWWSLVRATLGLPTDPAELNRYYAFYFFKVASYVFAVVAAVFVKINRLAPAIWFMAGTLVALAIASGYANTFPVISALADFSAYAQAGYVWDAVLRLIAHLSEAAVIVALILTSFVKRAQTLSGM